ncbi:MAG: cyclic nucleotide-binding domain-containing protein [Salinisphaeraceae bacterium]|nr:cyclic nucleotide-binding domain-containing protein [Salinisphaeraceae bacterium]
MTDSAVDYRELALLREHGHIRECARGDYIVREGERGKSICMVVAGSAAVLVEDDRGRELCVSILGPGTFFGEMGLYQDDWKRTASVRARSKCKIVEIEYGNFLSLAAEHNEYLIRIIHQLSNKLSEMTSRARQFVMMSANERILYVLTDLARQVDAEITTEGRLIAVTKHEVANMAGCSRETVSRALQELEEEGLIKNVARKVLVMTPAISRIE